MRIRAEALITAAMTGFAAMAAILVGGGCYSLAPMAYCCTNGDPATAYLTPVRTCPAGFNCIAPDDLANAKLTQPAKPLDPQPQPPEACPAAFHAARTRRPRRE